MYIILLICIPILYIYLYTFLLHILPLGFELLNEPAADLERRFHSDLLQYYKEAYAIIRKYNSKAMVVISVLWEDYYDMWSNEMREPEYYNVVFDW